MRTDSNLYATYIPLCCCDKLFLSFLPFCFNTKEAFIDIYFVNAFFFLKLVKTISQQVFIEMSLIRRVSVNFNYEIRKVVTISGSMNREYT